MALDRQSIEKKDFPIGRRGYDPEAVDTHLRDVADSVDGLKRSARQRTETVATTASEQVRAVISAAEASADEITRQAEEEAREIRDDASAEAKRTRDDANHSAHDYVGRVAEATSALLQRVDAMQGELNTLLDTLRTGANRVHADLQLLEGNLGELASVAGRPRFEPEPPDAVEPPSARPLAPAIGREPVAQEDPDAPRRNGSAPLDRDALVADPDAPVAATPASASPVAAAPAAAPAAASTGDDNEESARLVALDMALSGTSREETDVYLAEHFNLADRAALLDEVYASIGG
ncbi:DivIVA domain-containing protein [Conexibacter sp. JD483]|uniref:DivIVA domain-containing protein n=1 Tax=unclassified Conexibacter TaxID=2627773 RepID=UPI0027264857|nr:MULTISPECIES: DivIVA domain-containing protein [unclassified Conexibacter]MDO8184829.1 DivIVA domain-containing protein [Conexibacter sp. CPCC 205706]MDO8196604.1 DivIVA domain-containing protein [Conexibacter sp. CPCC 205762]MDR9368683.1 DivIVA domain-containing protein [Conexibacter sp. JD483]